jgi:hypothetical protein
MGSPNKDWKVQLARDALANCDWGRNKPVKLTMDAETDSKHIRPCPGLLGIAFCRALRAAKMSFATSPVSLAKRKQALQAHFRLPVWQHEGVHKTSDKFFETAQSHSTWTSDDSVYVLVTTRVCTHPLFARLQLAMLHCAEPTFQKSYKPIDYLSWVPSRSFKQYRMGLQKGCQTECTSEETMLLRHGELQRAHAQQMPELMNPQSHQLILPPSLNKRDCCVPGRNWRAGQDSEWHKQ